MSELSGKTVLITGASSGIGEATVRELANTGAKLFIGARRGDRLEARSKELGDAVHWRTLDVTDGNDFDAFAALRISDVNSLPQMSSFDSMCERCNALMFKTRGNDHKT